MKKWFYLLLLVALVSFVLAGCMSKIDKLQNDSQEMTIDKTCYVDLDLLHSYGITDEQIEKLNDDVLIIQNFIENGMEKNEVTKAVNAFLSEVDTSTSIEPDVVVPQAPVPNKKEINTLMETGHGCYWYLDSVTGYYNATGRAMTSEAVINVNVSKHTVPYFFFGAFSTSSWIYSEAGIYYDKYSNSWKTYYSISNGTGWKAGSGTIPSNHDAYINFKILDNAMYYAIYDLTTWTKVDERTIAISGASYNDEGTNMRIYRETSLAQDPIQNLDCGAYFLDAHWEQVYLYSKSGYSLWTSSKTHDHYEYDGDDSKNRVNVSITSTYYEDIVDIDYR